MAATTYDEERSSSARPQTLSWRRLAALFLPAIICILLGSQLVLWGVGIANAGGLERYVRRHSDYRAVLTGGLMIHEGRGALLYDLAAQHDFQVRVLAPYYTLVADSTLPNSHPPIESLIIAPFMHLPYGVLYLGWTAIEVLALAGALALLATIAPMRPSTRWLLIALACSFHPLHRLLWLGQSTTLVLLGICFCYAARQRGWHGLSGVGLAVAALKPQLALPFVLICLLERWWRALGTMFAIWAGVTVALMPILGVAWPLRYAAFLASSRHWGEAYGEHPHLMYSWQGLLTHMLGTGGAGLVAPLAAIASVLTFGIFCWVWWRYCRGGQVFANQGARGDLLWALATMVALLTPQHLYAHDLLLLIVPAWIVAARVTAEHAAPGARRGWVAVLAAGYALPLLLFFFVDHPVIAVVPGVLFLVGVLIALSCWLLRTSTNPGRTGLTSA